MLKELNDAVALVLKEKAKTVLIQLPDGLKPKSAFIVDYLEKETDCSCFIWAGSCYGSCDVPSFECDLIIQFGHNDKLRIGY